MREVRDIAPERGILTQLTRTWDAVFGVSQRFTRTSPPGAAAAAILITLGLVAIFAYQLAPYDPLDTSALHFQKPPSRERLLGSDHVGRDALSRIIVGTRTSLYVAFVSVALAKVVGFSWGVLSGYLGGKFDLISQRFLDVLISFPGVILALLLLAGLGAGLYTVIMAIAFTGIAGTTRVIRSVVLSVREMAYVEGARALGASQLRIMIRHVAPQCIAPLMVVASASLGGAIFAEAALSFLGLGIPPPHPSLGNMLGGVLGDVFKPPWWLVIYPGVTITVAILAFNIFGDGLRDHLDPKLRGRLD